jgi:phosphatidylglycerophosphate synthase
MIQAARLSLPDVISLSRLVFAAAFIALPAPAARVALIAAAGITDFLDGWIARRRNIDSARGALLDPITDRVFAFVAMTTLLFEGLFTTGEFVILLARDLMTAIGFLVARVVTWLRPVQFKARFAGKVVTTLQFVTLIAALIVPALVTPLVVAVAFAAVWAIVDYTLMLWEARAH